LKGYSILPMNHNGFTKYHLIKRVRWYILAALSICIMVYLLQPIETCQSKDDLDLQVKEVMGKVDTQNLRNTIAHLQSYGNRSTWEKQKEAAEWVYGQFKKLGITVSLNEYELDGKKWPNIIAEIAGSKRSEEIVMLIAHIDSISDSSQNVAPGADDNGSGVAVLLEGARILGKARMERTVMLCIFTNEENCAAGSKAYARRAKEEGLNMKSVINLDILGYNRPTWPFYWDAVQGHGTLKHKVKATIRMARNYFLGIINGKDIVRVAGREANRSLVTIASQILRQSSGLKAKEMVKDDNG
jgi:Zn-dependent M28 family amino/carboxypeptidase